jgi:hypothetical protein
VLLDNIFKRPGEAGVTKIRIGSLASNRSARAHYERAALSPNVLPLFPFEIIYER